MEVRSGYKYTDVGIIPDSWIESELSMLCRVPITYGIVQCGPHIPDGIPYIRVSDMKGRDLDIGEMLRTTQEIAVKFPRSTVEDGDIVYALRGKLGEVRRVRGTVVGSNLTQGTARISPKESISSEYLFWALRNPKSLLQAEMESKGTTFREITLSDLRKIKIAVPTKLEQEAIAEALSDADAYIESLEQLIAKKRLIKQGVMQELLTGKRRLPGFSGDWEMKRLGDIAIVKDGTHQTPQYVPFGIPFYSVEHVTSGDFSNTKFISEEEHRFLTRSFRIEKGDVLMTRIGSIGDCILVDWEVNASFYVSLALLKIHGAYAPYIAAYSGLREFKNEVDLHSLPSATPKKINLGPISDVNVALPPTIEEQQAIANILLEMDAEISTLKEQLDKVHKIKKGMMQELLTGRIRLV